MPKKCKTCGGRYARRQDDGTVYFHTCPPATEVRVKRGGVTQFVALADVKNTDTIRVQRAGVALETTVAAMLPDDARLDDRDVPRPNRRDENIKGGTGADASEMRAPGAGADDE